MEKRTILFVGADEALFYRARAELSAEAIDLLAAQHSAQAMEMLAFRSVQVIIGTAQLPKSTGVEFFQRVKYRYPLAVRVLLADPHAVAGAEMQQIINHGEVYRLLNPDWQQGEFPLVVRQCLDHYDLVERNQQLLSQVQTQNEALRRFNEQLERLVQERTHMLRLSQEILENLFVPVVGVSTEGIVVLPNASLRNLFKDSPHLVAGSKVETCLPEPVCRIIQECLRAGSAQETELSVGDRQWRVTAQPLAGANAVKGCIVYMFERTHDRP